MNDLSTVGLQLIDLLAAVSLLLAFGLLIQRRLTALIDFYALQSLVLVIVTSLVGWLTGQRHLYLSAALTMVLKVLLIPILLYRLVRRLRLETSHDTLVKLPATLLLGLLLVIFAFDVARPIAQLSTAIASGTLGIALAGILVGFLMMISRSRAISQVIAFLAMENGVFLAATAVTHGMPMVVELGIAVDVLIGVLILGVFLFHLQDAADSLEAGGPASPTARLERSGPETPKPRKARTQTP